MDFKNIVIEKIGDKEHIATSKITNYSSYGRTEEEAIDSLVVMHGIAIEHLRRVIEDKKNREQQNDVAK